jgi:hypothetical protein
VITFAQFIIEYPLEYYAGLPDVRPPKTVEAAAARFGLWSHIKWVQLNSKQFKHSYEIETNSPDGIIAMRPGDSIENFFHELGHEILTHTDKDFIESTIKPLLDRIKVACRPSHEWLKQQTGTRYLWIELGEWKYSFSHSGFQYQYDELFAISFAFVMGDGKFKQPDLQQDFENLLDRLTVVK